MSDEYRPFWRMRSDVEMDESPVTVSFRVTCGMKRRLEEVVERYGITKSEFFRGSVKRLMLEESELLVSELMGWGDD